MSFCSMISPRYVGAPTPSSVLQPCLSSFISSNTTVFPHFLESAMPGIICLEYSFFLLYLLMSISSFRHQHRYHFWKAFPPIQHSFSVFLFFSGNSLLCSNRSFPLLPPRSILALSTSYGNFSVRTGSKV